MSFTAAYGIDPVSNVDSPQCSGSGDFCFFCAFEAAPDTVGTDCDLHGSMKDMVKHYASQDRELPAITDVVSKMYNDSVRNHIVWTHPATNITLEKPEWTKDSIRRHLLHSGEFKNLFCSVVRQMFHSIICKQNESMICSETGMVVEEHRKAFVDTVGAYSKWLDTCRKQLKPG